METAVAIPVHEIAGRQGDRFPAAAFGSEASDYRLLSRCLRIEFDDIAASLVGCSQMILEAGQGSHRKTNPTAARAVISQYGATDKMDGEAVAGDLCQQISFLRHSNTVSGGGKKFHWKAKTNQWLVTSVAEFSGFPRGFVLGRGARFCYRRRPVWWFYGTGI